MKIGIILMQSAFVALILYPLVDAKSNPGTYILVGMLCGAVMGAVAGLSQKGKDNKDDGQGPTS